MPKQPRSFSLDEDIADILSERDDINPSAVVNQFLRQYLAGGLNAGGLEDSFVYLKQQIRVVAFR